MRLMKIISAAIIASAFSTAPVLAQESVTLKKIKETDRITLGHHESSIPFSYYDDKQQINGYSHELMLKAVKVVDAALTKAMASGEAEKIYTKWFINSILPKGLNQGIPLSEKMKALYKAPNDKAFE